MADKQIDKQQFDGILRKMLNTPPEPKKDIKASAKKKLGKVIPSKE